MAKQPNNPFHPGEILIEEFLEPMGMTQAEFARQQIQELTGSVVDARH